MSDSDLRPVAAVTEKTAIRRLSCLEAMKERRGEVTCFTPALLITHAKMPVDPLNEFVARFNVPENGRPFCVEIAPPVLPFFSGLGVTLSAAGPIDWDRRLYAIKNDYAKSCFDFLGGLGVTSENFMASAVTYTVDIPDPTMPQFSGNQHYIPVTVFGVLCDDKITYLEPNGHLPPFLKTVPAAAALRHSAQFQTGLDSDSLKKIREQL